jgi:hypothetical protein
MEQMDRKSSVEIWKPIVGYDGYEISNLGRVKSVKFGKEKIMKNDKNEDGYLRVNLCKEGNHKHFKVHRLVAQAFIPNPNNFPIINHKNEIKTDNRVENLEWCTYSYNNTYNDRAKKSGKKSGKTLTRPILQFTKDGEFVRRWDSAIQVESELGIKYSGITKCCEGRYKTSGGYVWGYEKDYERIPFKVFELELYRKKIA